MSKVYIQHEHEHEQWEQQVEQVEHGLFLSLSLCLFLCPSEEGEEVQPAVEPNEQEDVDTVEQRMDPHLKHQHEVAVADQAG